MRRRSFNNGVRSYIYILVLSDGMDVLTGTTMIRSLGCCSTLQLLHHLPPLRVQQVQCQPLRFVTCRPNHTPEYCLCSTCLAIPLALLTSQSTPTRTMDAAPKPVPEINFSTQGRVAIIRINQPKKLGALSQDLFFHLSQLMRHIDGRDDIFITVLTGTGRFFSA